ncbi:serine/threonine-protein kinase [Desmonostoc muscorum LEGE 12446]|uniref:non-specific serine/threonine protein kinase n=2 Tax=Desmonostoc muscorum TaxID=1179 RepID=A0A8J6ZW09_DESMC|nr:serine/threonine-protein kinase [Desmonostoc muscorum]MCF2145374.1 serine/threonine-protein kinase [Desmonostoc muscorum LEGE 12446]
MLYCSNPSCSNPFNPDDNKFCIKCGETLTLLFRNRFRVIRLLGEGGFSRTYEARDADRIDEPCVIKQFVPQVQGTTALEKATELFKQEAKRLYDLGEHPQIPRLIAYFEQDKRLYLVQELIEGQNLLQELQQQGAFSEEKIKQLLVDILPVLKLIHERGVIHRDIKPENIMRRRQDGKLILIDFGVSKQITASALGVGTTVGTPGYAPIEQMRGQVFPASDLYSLGVTCIRLLTQYLPKSDGSDELYDVLRGCWVWRKYLPQDRSITPDLGQILDKLIQDYLKERYQSSEEVIKLVNAVGSPSSKPRYRKHIKTTTSSQPNYQSSSHHNLNAAVTASLTRLNELLASGRWQDANEKTFDILLTIADREKQGTLYLEDVEKLSCQELRTIDNLWTKYSNGHFGLSIQKQIWQKNIRVNQEVDEESLCRFGTKVGWLRPKIIRKELFGNADLFFEQKPPLWFYDLTFTIKAPKGHLPCFGILGMTLVVSLIFLRCEECGL